MAGYERKIPLMGYQRCWKDVIKMFVKDMYVEDMKWI
jgi:hypothetical protein